MRSQFDPTRDTVGSIASECAKKDFGIIEIGAMSSAIIPDLIADINEALTIPCEKPFFLLITEKKICKSKTQSKET